MSRTAGSLRQSASLTNWVSRRVQGLVLCRTRRFYTGQYLTRDTYVPFLSVRLSDQYWCYCVETIMSISSNVLLRLTGKSFVVKPINRGTKYRRGLRFSTNVADYRRNGIRDRPTGPRYRMRICRSYIATNHRYASATYRIMFRLPIPNPNPKP